MPLGIGDSGMLGSAIDDLTGQPRQSEREGGTRDTFEVQDFDTWYGDNLEAGAWVDLAEYVVEPQTAYRWGHGSAPVEETLGRMAAHFEDGAGNQVKGSVRLKTRNANDENADTEVAGIPTRKLDKLSASKRDKYAQPEVGAKVGEESKLVVQFRLSSASAGTSIDETADPSEVEMDVTRYS